MLSEAELRALLDLVGGSDLFELEVEHDGLRVCIRRDPASLATPPQAAASAGPAAPPTAAPPVDLSHVIASPRVGVFHSSVRAGDAVAPGQAVGTVEALRMRHPVEAEVGGMVEEVLASDGHAVEYGQALVRLRTESAR
ncbi:MAG: acetyl-CoA carboxylase biotin carboxyl carrier protein [Chloroflexi bacterium]|nr:acetyl-CoA carboxylase biotin carboxyl carrier protein [Chloroflexota bacterium]